MLILVGDIIGSWLAISDVMLIIFNVVVGNVLKFDRKAPKHISKSWFVETIILNKSSAQCSWCGDCWHLCKLGGESWNSCKLQIHCTATAMVRKH